MDLAQVIQQIESAGNPRALRFEPAAYEKWPFSDTMGIIKAKHACNEATARMIACTSWGLYQILGENIFSRSMTKFSVNPPTIFSYVTDIGLQDMAFAGFLKMRAIDFTLEDLLADPDKMQLFVRSWNGPGAIDEYSQKIRQYASTS